MTKLNKIMNGNAKETDALLTIRPTNWPALDFYTVQVDSDTGLDFYKTYTTKRYSEIIFGKQVQKLRADRKGGCVTLFHNYEWVKEELVERVA